MYKCASIMHSKVVVILKLSSFALVDLKPRRLLRIFLLSNGNSRRKTFAKVPVVGDLLGNPLTPNKASLLWQHNFP